MSEHSFGGQIYLDPKSIPQEEVVNESIVWDEKESHPFQYQILAKKNVNKGQVIFKRRLAYWKDLTTPPKTKTKCVKWCSAGPFKTCCGWKTQTKWMYRSATLVVTTNVPQDIEGAIEECIKQAAIAAAITAIITGGSAAIAAAEAAFLSCLSKKLTDIVSLKIKTKSTWGSWS